MEAPPTPPNPSQLEALRRQRELIARHLTWLDQEIAKIAESKTFASHKQSTSYQSAPQSKTDRPPSIDTPGLPTVPNLSPNLTNETMAAGTVPEPAAPAADIFLPEPASGLSARDKWGCIVIIAVIALTILGALFVLPYFLHRD